MLLKANKYRKDKKSDCRRNELGSRIFMGRVFGDYAECLHFYPSFSYGRIIAGETSWSLERETGCGHRLIQEWTTKYLAEGEAGLEVKKKPGNPLSRYERRKEPTYEEQLQYQIELLKRELVKKEAEVLRLKKRNERKGGDARKR